MRCLSAVSSLAGATAACFALSFVAQAADKPSAEEGWVTLFDGKSFDGWKAAENEKSWKIENGAIVANGPRSHLFYVADKKPFVNFEFKAEVMTRPNSNAGIFFHTQYQAEGWPRIGYESQVNNTYKDPQKTGSLYNTVKILVAPAKDDEWYTHHIIVQGKHIVTKINDKTVVDYTEPDDVSGTARLGEGTFALQAHDPGSTVLFKNLRVKRLP
jgi:hypothetical protein